VSANETYLKHLNLDRTNFSAFYYAKTNNSLFSFFFFFSTSIKTKFVILLFFIDAFALKK